MLRCRGYHSLEPFAVPPPMPFLFCAGQAAHNPTGGSKLTRVLLSVGPCAKAFEVSRKGEGLLEALASFSHSHGAGTALWLCTFSCLRPYDTLR